MIRIPLSISRDEFFERLCGEAEVRKLHFSMGNAKKDFVDPIYTYTHKTGLAVIGGHVYRGTSIPELFGKYIYGDWSIAWDTKHGGGLFYLEEIGNKFSMTKQRIRVLEAEALRDLKKNKKLTKDK